MAATGPLDGQTSLAMDIVWQRLLMDGGMTNPPSQSISVALNTVYGQTGLANTAVLAGANAGSTPTLTVTGSDANVGLNITLKGSGSVAIGTGLNQVVLGWGGSSNVYASGFTTAPGNWTSGNALVLQYGGTGTDPRIVVSGYDTNPNLVLQGQGAGALIWKNASGTQEWKVDSLGNMSWAGSLAGGATAHAGTGDIAATEFIAAVTSTAAAYTLTLPTGTEGQLIIVQDQSGGAATHNITIAPPAGGTINGAASALINTAYGVQRLYCGSANGLSWYLW